MIVSFLFALLGFFLPAVSAAAVPPSTVSSQELLQDVTHDVHYHHGPDFSVAEMEHGPVDQVIAPAVVKRDEPSPAPSLEPSPVPSADNTENKMSKEEIVESVKNLLKSAEELVEKAPTPGTDDTEKKLSKEVLQYVKSVLKSLEEQIGKAKINFSSTIQEESVDGDAAKPDGTLRVRHPREASNLAKPA